MMVCDVGTGKRSVLVYVFWRGVVGGTLCGG